MATTRPTCKRQMLEIYAAIGGHEMQSSVRWALVTIDDLTQRLAAVLAECDEKSAQLNAANKTACEFAAKLAESEADAARYRFLREHKARASCLKMDGTATFHFTGGWPPLIGPNLDWAVDSAIGTWKIERQKEACGG